ncbi:AfsR/SARP family transcriptional regulator [Micromonospora sp. CA-259024]|uniref:AfsR/SARP family transcriptional regulator n=1 Tax=Micromonospora sp. CA-259024 TaxID=3239965 RepID=UPI003D94CE34
MISPAVGADAHPTGACATGDTLGQRASVGANRVRIRVLGPPTILGVPEEQHVRPQALEFLVYLIVRGGSAYQHEILGDLLPEPPHRLAAQRLHTYTYNLRQIFRSAGGDNIYLRLRRHHYTLNTEVLDVDLWAMREAMIAAQRGADPAASVTALRRAVAAYHGPLAADTGYLWLARHQQAVAHEFVTAAVTLAEVLADRPAEAIAVLDVAARQHPDNALLATAVARIRDRSS